MWYVKSAPCSEATRYPSSALILEKAKRTLPLASSYNMEIRNTLTSKVWKKSLRYVYENGQDFTDENSRVCREVLNLIAVIEKPHDDIAKPITVLNSFQKWIYPPLEELHNIVLRNKDSPAHHYLYGPRIFAHREKDQINDFIIPLLANNSNSRRAVAVLWDPSRDADVHGRMVPGWIMIDFKLRNGRLSATSVLRSNDLWFGWPASLYQTYVLQEYVAKKCGVQTGTLTTLSTSAHIFEDQFPYIQKILHEK
jgi:thymidylate synthase